MFAKNYVVDDVMDYQWGVDAEEQFDEYFESEVILAAKDDDPAKVKTLKPCVEKGKTKHKWTFNKKTTEFNCLNRMMGANGYIDEYYDEAVCFR